jgi:hypothetical protein
MSVQPTTIYAHDNNIILCNIIICYSQRYLAEPCYRRHMWLPSSIFPLDFAYSFLYSNLPCTDRRRNPLKTDSFKFSIERPCFFLFFYCSFVVEKCDAQPSGNTLREDLAPHRSNASHAHYYKYNINDV